MRCARRSSWATSTARRLCLALLLLLLLPQLVQPVRTLAQLPTPGASNSTPPCAVEAHPPPPSVLLVVARCAEDLSWLERQTTYPYLMYQKCQQQPAAGHSANHRFLPLNVGSEAEAYLTFIVDEYHRLPETVVFSHGHAGSWHQTGNVLSLLDGLGDLSKISYLNLNYELYNSYELEPGAVPERFARSYDGPPLSNLYFAATNTERNMTSFFALYGGVHKEQLPPYYIVRCCAQYVVSRSTIRSRSLRRWRRILNTMYLRGDAEKPRHVGYDLEMMFFYLFTGLHDEYQYMQDKRYLKDKV